MADLIFTRLYAPRAGQSVELNFIPGGNSAAAAVAAVTDDAVAAVIAIPSAPIVSSAVTDDAIANVAVVPGISVTVAAVTEDATGSVIAATYGVIAVTATTDDAVAQVLCGVVHYIDVNVTTDDAVAVVEGLYDSAVWRGLVRAVQSSYQQGACVVSQIKSGWNRPDNVQPEISTVWQPPIDVAAPIESAWQLTVIKQHHDALAWGSVEALSKTVQSTFENPGRKALADVLAWDAIAAKQLEMVSGWLIPGAKHHDDAVVFEDGRQLTLCRVLIGNQAPNKWRDERSIPWEEADPHNWIVGPIVEPPVIIPPREWLPALVFRCRKPSWVNGKRTRLVFSLGCPWPAVPFIPKQRVYFVQNSVTIVRLPEMTELHCDQLSISGDVDNWAWSFNAVMLTQIQLPLVKPDEFGDLREVRITINGASWDFIVENWGLSRTFGQSSISISGRSTSAYLAEPFALISDDSNAVDITANQLAELAVQFTDWTIDWQLVDWLVTAGAWNYRGTAMGRLLKIAEAVGGVVQSAPQAKSISLIKRYPELPWNWASVTPYAQIPADIMTNMGSDFVKKPDYNSVWVSGESQGITAQIKRTGTAGDVNASMFVNPLLTHVDATRMAGESILSDVGAQERVRFDMPVESTLGVIPLLKIVEIDDTELWRGITRSININARWSNGLTVRQLLEVEKHG